MKAIRTEPAIKSALIDRLFAKGEVCPDAVVISEMVVDSWSRRADVVLANGKLSAFEIKSDLDSLTRLPGQLETYRNFFERVVVVITPRFLKRVEEMAPDGVGIWVVEGDGHEGIREKRRARTFELSAEAAINLMTVTDLRRLLAANGVTGVRRATRRELEILARNLTRKDLAAAARDSVKRRFRGHFKRFMTRRGSQGTKSALRALRRVQRTIKRASDEAPQVELPEVVIRADHPMLVNAPAGAILRRAVYPSTSSKSSALLPPTEA
jgi:hypothetical protein